VTRFLFRRVIFMITTLFVISVLSFAIPHLGKANPARIVLQAQLGNTAVDPAAVAKVSKQLGLDRPLFVQYIEWLKQVLHGNLGYSFTDQQPVLGLVLSAIRISTTLALVALAMATIIALPAGILSSLKPGGKLDVFITSSTQSFIPIPEYWFGPFAILVFAVWLRWFPAAGWYGIQHVVLPASVLALRPLAYLTSITRASMIDVLNSQYIVASRSRGLGKWRTLLHHGIRNGMPPVMTMFSLYLASLVGGAVIVEVVFAIPGTGRLLYQAVVNSDIPTIQGTILCVVSLVVVITTLADIGYKLLNPAVVIGE
jgi:peptide/nickel transport system permease protein